VVNQINENPYLLPGIKLGVHVLDSCDSETYALEQTFEFIKGFMTRIQGNSSKFTCPDESKPKYREGKFDKFVGLIGAQSSSVSITLANILRLFHVPQISYFSTSPTLSNKMRFEYFFRTVPSDVNQAQAILQVLREFDWTYVSIVYSDTDYGNKGYDLLSALGHRYNICFSHPQTINVENQKSDADYDRIITKLVNNNVRGEFI